MSLQTLSLGVLLARVVVGSVMAAHGAQKLFGWFGGYGLHKTGEFFGHLGFYHGRVFAAAASLTEITAGLLLVVGLLGPIGPALMISVMIVALVTVHWQHGLFASTNGIEVPLLYLTAGVGLGTVGFGRYSLDALLGIAGLWSPTLTWSILGAGALGGIANLALRHRPALHGATASASAAPRAS
jgi:putative oxidoreductase